ncbi:MULTISPECIES: PPE family protein [unclassified Mycobacterium]|uniref:PPE family protein n=1 Tax=unclassified Mycobacterium TaxID=2642494 RepID=UPI000F9D1189|nr:MULTISPECIES: PPE family protein [unclassified Mycobacterium]MDP7706156.1 PPE family protein [Mycobacterium sp. TY815]MDP7726073.1 PPE family protein [Mycobacterium sp. TY814]RUP07178.1 MAG: PPE family protein [Mycobacterium sp.]
MFWHAMPPELNTARLMAGAGPAPMLAAAMGWQALAAALDAQAVELTARLNSLGEAWTGGSSDKAISNALPMVTWLQTTSTQAKTRGLQAAAQAAAYTQAMATTPSLPEIAMNHVTTAVLTATNFFGINTIPIAMNEIDYFVRMWTQAAVAMDIYQAETLANTMFDKIEPMASILDPGMSQGMSSTQMLAMPSSLTSSQLQATAGQVAELSGPMQQLAQPAQQMTSMFSQMGGSSGGPSAGLGEDEAQLGLVGASPLSNHPLAGGSGASVGAGLLRGEALPGAGGTLARTPLMTGLIDKPVGPAMMPAAAAGESATGGAAPVGAGAMGQGASGGGSSRPGLAAPAPVSQERDEPEEDLWDDEDEW